MPDNNNTGKKDTTNTRGTEIPLDYLMWNSLQGVPLRGEVENGITVLKNEHQVFQAPPPLKNDTAQMSEQGLSEYISAVRAYFESNKVPTTVINDIIGMLHVTHPVTWGNYYNSKGVLSPLANSGQWKGFFDWRANIQFGPEGNSFKTNIKYLSNHAKEQIKHFRITRGASVASSYVGGAIYAVTVYDEWGNIIDGTANYGKLAADGIFTVIGICGGPYGVAISMIYFTVDVAFEKDGKGGWERLFQPVKEVYLQMVDAICRLNDPATWRNYILSFYR
jgi:hypothetical protein